MRYNNEIWPINNPTRASECSSESHTYLTLNQKLESIMFSEEDILKAQIGWKLSTS